VVFGRIASGWRHFRRRLTNAPLREALERLEQRAQQLAGQVELLSADRRAQDDTAAASALETSQRSQVELAEIRAILQSATDRQSLETAMRLQAEELAIVRNEMAALKADLQPLAGSNIPVYLTPELRPAAKPHRGVSGHRIAICSLPKSGTYFLAEVLSQMGCVATQLHLSSNACTDYRCATRKEAREEYKRFNTLLELSKSLALVLPGQFAVGHLECSPRNRALLADFKKVFLYRDLRDGLASFLRFHADTQREGPRTRVWSDLPDGPEKMLRFLDHLGHAYFAMCLPMGDWLDQGDVFKLSFETLYGDPGTSAQVDALEALYSHLEIAQRLVPPEELVARVMGRPTKTWSGQRTEREVYWNDEVEARFREFGGQELNARLGYGHEQAQGAA
jgi:hypothetical protein